MIKEIKYSGYSASPSDYESLDGPMAAMVNLIPEDGALKPIFPPRPILDCNLGGVVKLIHHVADQDNYIIARKSERAIGLYWLKKSLVYTNEENASLISSFSAINDIAIIGNTLIVATDSGINYILWRDGNYKHLGSKPPFVPISFGVTRVQRVYRNETLLIEYERSESGGSVKPKDTEDNSNAVLGFLLSNINEHITSKGYFYTPFFVRYAFRMFDGSYIMQSAPVLMLPSVIPPILSIGSIDSSGVQTMLSIDVCTLDYKILKDSWTNTLNNWKDIIAGIDIFVSAPIYTFNQAKRIKDRFSNLLGVLSNCYYGWSNSNEVGQNPSEADSEIVPPDDTETASVNDTPDVSTSGSAGNVRPGDGSDGTGIPDRVFIGHYQDASEWSDTLHTNVGYIDRFRDITNAASQKCWELARNDNFHDEIKGVKNFYKIASIDIDDIKEMNKYERVPMRKDALESLNTKPTLPDDYQTHCHLKASFLHAYNSRLNLADVTITPAQPLPLHSCAAATTFDSIAEQVEITVYTRTNGIITKTVSKNTLRNNNWDLDNNFPRYIYYPDATAYKMVLKSLTTEVILNLTPHDFLNGAYWYGSFDEVAKPLTNAEQETMPAAASVPLGNKIYTSEVNNPFLFPALGINTVGTGTLLRISSANKALSQGQFGHFPLYAFSTDGVWALEVGNTGFYSARQPITRDVCSNSKGITQLDSSVLFPTSRGIMLLSGSETICLTDAINTESPFSPSILPSIDKVAAIAGFNPGNYDYQPFNSFLRNSKILYDYPNQRIILSSDTEYAYVYSLKSKEWGMMPNYILSTINSYPEALAMSRDGKLIDFSKAYAAWNFVDKPTTPFIPTGTPLDELTGLQQQSEAFGVNPSAAIPKDMNSKGYFVTRPFKLDMPDILKTIDTVIQRGQFREGHVASVLYGSRDLYNWFPIWSSKDRYMRGFRGTPYKYFRIACVTDFSSDECIFGATVQFTPRLTNQPR